MNWLLLLPGLAVVLIVLAGLYNRGRPGTTCIRRDYARSRQLDEQVLDAAGGFDDALRDEDPPLS